MVHFDYGITGDDVDPISRHCVDDLVSGEAPERRHQSCPGTKTESGQGFF